MSDQGVEHKTQLPKLNFGRQFPVFLCVFFWVGSCNFDTPKMDFCDEKFFGTWETLSSFFFSGFWRKQHGAEGSCLEMT